MSLTHNERRQNIVKYHSVLLHLLTSYVAKKFRYVSCMQRTFQRNDFELILMVNIKTRHPTEDHLVVNFLSPHLI